MLGSIGRARRLPHVAGAVALLCVAPLAAQPAAQATAAKPGQHSQHGHQHRNIGRAPVATSSTQADRQRTVRPLPRKRGSVPLRRATTIRPKPLGLPAHRGGPAAKTAASAAGAQVALRALVIAVDGDDWGVATWNAALDRVGAAYDVLHSRTSPLTDAALVRPDGTGRYNAVLLTNSMQLLRRPSGGCVSGLDADEWNLLWAYERDYAVRQATLYTSYGTCPEDYCLRRVRARAAWAGHPLSASLTAAGRAVFDDLQGRRSRPDHPVVRVPHRGRGGLRRLAGAGRTATTSSAC